VKIAPHYSGPVVYVPDASRSVGVCTNLLSAGLQARYVADVRADYERIRSQHAGKRGQAPLVPLAEARANAFPTDWKRYVPPAPQRLGRQVFASYDLAELARYVDWTPFFQAWELTGSYPKILEDPVVGAAARNVFRDARAMLERVIAERWLTANAVIGLYPANSVGDDIEVYADERRREIAAVFHCLRQQTQKAADRHNLCLADFVAPKASGVPDYFGAFAVTAGIGCEARVKRFEADHDDYSAILLKALADRLAEAFAELMHERVRKEFWGYAPEEALTNEARIAEQYRGIRPAPGYPACPDHTEKAPLFELLDAPAVGITLTENYAMWPPAAVSGFYFSHPGARYFAVGKIDRDQAQDYARRKRTDLDKTERWLAPALAYDT
jgi:5-methyltetrahydrofolate--homocysteine methyltransferase